MRMQTISEDALFIEGIKRAERQRIVRILRDLAEVASCRCPDAPRIHDLGCPRSCWLDAARAVDML